MPMLEGRVDAVIGVDTHRDRHAAAVLDPNGGVRATLEVPSDQAGHARLLRLAQVQASGRRVWALEGTGCYGAGLTRFLVDQGEWVVEIDRPKRSRGRHGAKSDVLDAVRAGREALARDHLTSPRQHGHREALRVLHTTRAGVVAAGADARRQLKALIITAPEPLRDRLRGRPWRQQVHACAELVAAPGDPVEHRATVQALALTAQRVLAARQDAHRLEAELRQLVTVMAPALLTKPGIGPITAAQLLISWSHPGRFRRSPPGSRACRPSGRSCRRSRAAVGSRSPFIWRPRWPGRIWVPNSLREMANCDRKHVGVTDRVLPAVGVSGLWSKCPPKSPEQRPICVT
jgi:transposase